MHFKWHYSYLSLVKQTLFGRDKFLIPRVVDLIFYYFIGYFACMFISDPGFWF